ncbi:MAG: Xaa-Pro peptidase family protein [Chloroflexota bacterium]
MKSDLDRLMQERNLDAFIVATDESYHAVRDYLTNGARVTGGYVLKKHGEPAVMIVAGMEVEEAKASGLTVYTREQLGYADLLEQYRKEPALLRANCWRTMFESIHLTGGRVGVYGSGELNVYYELFRIMEEQLPGYELVGEMGKTLFDEAMVTKDADEIARITSVAQRTSEVVRLTWDFIAAHRADGDTVVNADGNPLTIGDVKRFIRRELLDRDLEDTGMIFAQGRDGAFPHSRGTEGDPLQQGQAIVFDLFPREFGGGYHHDMTRTWSIGYATDEVKAIYNTVMEAFDRAIEQTRAGVEGKVPQEAVLDYFESLGHPTPRSHPGTGEGYVHSLGHGVGLNIHERPRMHHLFSDVLQKGSVVTIEPGLYYPEKGCGVRIEDMVYIDDSGAVVTLTDFHKELVIPLNG